MSAFHGALPPSQKRDARQSPSQLTIMTEGRLDVIINTACRPECLFFFLFFFKRVRFLRRPTMVIAIVCVNDYKIADNFQLYNFHDKQQAKQKMAAHM